MLSSLRVLLQQSNGGVGRQLRGMANYHKPRFVGGNAKPHEFVRRFRQAMYTEGEIWASGIISMIGFVTLAVLNGLPSERNRIVDENAENFTIMAHYATYPYPIRKED